MSSKSRSGRRVAPFAAIVLAVTAVGGIPTAGMAQDTIELEYLTNQYVPETSDVLKETIALYEAENPGVKIKLTEVPFPSLFETIDTTLASGAPVMDLFSADAPLVPKYAAAGAILPLDDYYTDEEIADFLPGSLAEALWDGSFVAPPQISSSQGIYVNKALFEEAGVPLPSTDPTERLTWQEVADLAKALTKREGDVTTQWGLLIEQSTAPYQLYPLIQSLGGEVISPDGTTVDGYMNSPEAVEAMTFYQDLYCTDKVSPQEPVPEAFTSGKTAMMLGGTWHVGNFASVEGLDWIMTPHPYFEAVVTPTGAFHVAVNANTDHPEAAADFAKYLTGQERSIALFEATNEIPTRSSVFEALPEKFAAHPNDIFTYELENTAVARPRTPAYGAMEDVLRGTFQSIITCSDVQTTLDDAVARIDPLLSE
jgi:ABC-type glycerol-3-phosphate transport system substrate-binding protein